MAVLDLQEQEQVDEFKAWWSDNGKWLLITVTLVIVGFAAMQGWKFYTEKKLTEASMLYGELEKQLTSNDPKRINDAATAVIDNYDSTVYAPRAALLAAQVNIESNDLPRAKTQLEWVIKHAEETGLQNVARLKLASVLLDEKKYDDALKLVNQKHAESFEGLYADLKGDVLHAQGKADEARAAYQLALNKTAAQSQYRTLIQVKLDALGGAK
ncbi:tetratricopeptide repeat protein [Candidatus Nitrotoga sp. M5]|uniref:tetratricopeptide repeat protein n=1 Tax=Candidatus Nitrotoga sp. M5 TaxID=2890409 RepID=UPI001EF20BCB|nr:tetratricopeptide repeat protein [Candidatus Nitrotoga sp. M5]CAH1386734.1 TPR_21 domain-containing protein [Candidatus Nitrotoga sp. M5]